MDGQEPEVVKTEGTQEVTETKVESEVKPEVKVEEDLKPKPGDPEWYVKKFGKMTAKLYGKEAENQKLRDELKKYKTEQTAPKAPVPNSYINAYGEIDNDAYQKAMGDFVDKHTEYKRSKDEVAELENQFQVRLQERVDVFNNQVAELRKSIPDIDQVISKPVWKNVLGTPLEYAIYESDESARVADYLGRNEAEIIRLSKLPVEKIGENIGRIEEKLLFLEKKTSKAVDPIKPLGGNIGVVQKDEKDMTDQEWADMRKKERLRQLQKG